MSTLTHPIQHILERIMTDALEDHEGTVSTEGRTITNLNFEERKNDLLGFFAMQQASKTLPFCRKVCRK